MTTSSKRWAGAALLLFATLPATFAATGCRQKDVCEDVSGPCLTLQVVGRAAPGMYDELQTTLQLTAAAPVVGSTTGAIELPLTLRVVPPAGVLPSSVHGLAVAGLLGGTELATAQTLPSFAWADDEHQTVVLELNPPDGADLGVPPGADLAGPPADLAGPPADMTLPPAPNLKWFAEANPAGKNELFHVWTGSATQTFTVGAGGTVLSRQPAGAWLAETAGTTSTLYGLSGIPGGSLWTTGDNPGAWRRDSASGKWLPDQQGLVLTPQLTLWSVVPGATAGELWAGSEDGKVWHRQGSPAASGTWQSEQALPTGVTVYSLAYADGAVFAVGQRGYVAVRKDTGSGARWQPAFQYPALAGAVMGHDDGLYGAWAFDRNTAVAVGSKGLMVRYAGGTWQPTPLTIDPSANEFNGVWGSAPGRVWAVGYGGIIVRVDGVKPTELRTDPNQNLYGIFGRSESDIYAVGSSFNGFSLILHGQP